MTIKDEYKINAIMNASQFNYYSGPPLAVLLCLQAIVSSGTDVGHGQSRLPWQPHASTSRTMSVEKTENNVPID